MSSREEHDSVRWQIELRTTLLFGEERAIANRVQIDAAAVAIHRLRRAYETAAPGDFAMLDPENLPGG